MKKTIFLTLILNCFFITAETSDEKINSIINAINQSMRVQNISNATNNALNNELRKYFKNLSQEKIDFYFDGLKKGMLNGFIGTIIGMYIARSAMIKIRQGIKNYLKEETEEQRQNAEKILAEAEEKLGNEKLIIFYIFLNSLINTQTKRSHTEKIEKIRQILNIICSKNELELKSQYKNFIPNFPQIVEIFHDSPSPEVLDYCINLYDVMLDERQVENILQRLTNR